MNLMNGDIIAFEAPEGFVFLTDDLLFVPYAKGQPYLLNRQSQERYPINRIYPEKLPGGDVETGMVNPDVILPLLQSADQVFVWDDLLVVVGTDPERPNSQNYLVSELDLFGESNNGDFIRRFLDERRVPFQVSYKRYYPEGLPSHSGAFLARQDGIYSASTGERIVEGFSAPSYGYFVPAGWVYDDRGVILHPGGVYLLDLRAFYLGRYIRVPQPVLMLKVPAEYLPAAE